MAEVGFILIQAIDIFCKIMEWLIFARIILSWIPQLRGNMIVQFIYALTEPLLAPLRALLNKSPLGGAGMPFDFSPLLAYLVLRFGSSLLIDLIIRLFLK